MGDPNFAWWCIQPCLQMLKYGNFLQSATQRVDIIIVCWGVVYELAPTDFIDFKTIWADSVLSYVVPCQQISACPQVRTHASIQLMSEGLASEIPRALLHVSTCRIRDAKNVIVCQHMSPHGGTYQQMSTLPQMATHDSIQTRSKWLVPEVPRVILHVGTCWHLLTHVGTCQCMSACFQVLAHIRTSRNAGTWIRSKWLDGLNFEGIAAPTLVSQVKKVEWQNNLATNVIEWDKYVIIHHLSMQPAYIPMINLLVI